MSERPCCLLASVLLATTPSCATAPSDESAPPRGVTVDPTNDPAEPVVVEEISITGFDSNGEPVIRRLADSSLQIQLEAGPPSFAEDDGTEEEFDVKMEAALGVAVDWEDRELFVIREPAPDTLAKAKAWLAAFTDGAGP